MDTFCEIPRLPHCHYQQEQEDNSTIIGILGRGKAKPGRFAHSRDLMREDLVQLAISPASLED
ncbi:MAG TPA: hypothetical protein V6C86_16680 [Oculatellaceae cyanobacterium]